MSPRLMTRVLLGCALLAPLTPVATGDVTIASPLHAAPAATPGPVTPLVLDLEALDVVRGLAEVTFTGFPLGADGAVALELTRREIFSADAVILRGDQVLPRPDIILLTGHVAGDPDSLVVLGLSPRAVNGLIEHDGETYVISSGSARARGGTVIFNPRDLPDDAIQWRPWACMTDALAPILAQAGTTGGATGGGVAGTGGEPPCRVVEVAVETDDEFTDELFDGDSELSGAYVALIFAAASEIFARDVNTRFIISFIRLWDGFLLDPWDATGTSAQLTQFRSFWNANMTDVRRDVAHFLSGRELGGGIAWLPGLCQGTTGYGLSANINGSFPYPLQDHDAQNWDIIVVAHELGHNFGAPHTHSHIPPIDNCGNGDCTGAENGTIMSYCHQCPGGLANFNLHFHPMIIDNILAYLDNGAPCNLLTNSGPDLDHNGTVGPIDMVILLGMWGVCPSAACAADLDCNGRVDISDLLELFANWDS